VHLLLIRARDTVTLEFSGDGIRSHRSTYNSEWCDKQARERKASDTVRVEFVPIGQQARMSVGGYDNVEVVFDGSRLVLCCQLVVDSSVPASRTMDQSLDHLQCHWTVWNLRGTVSHVRQEQVALFNQNGIRFPSVNRMQQRSKGNDNG
jgi:hypothetical protein